MHLSDFISFQLIRQSEVNGADQTTMPKAAAKKKKLAENEMD